MVSPLLIPGVSSAILGGGDDIYVYDSFDRANSATTMGNANTGQTWTPNNGTWGINSNQAYNSGGTAGVGTVIDCLHSNVILTCTLNRNGSGGPGLIFRQVDTGNYWYFWSDGVRLVILSVQAGVATIRYDASPASGNSWNVLLACVGDRINLIKPGSFNISLTSSINQSGTKFGLHITAANTAPRWNNFLIRSPFES